MKATTDTKGHSSVQGGLRGHSIGEDYPITVSYQGIIGKGHWKVWNVLTNENLAYTDTSKEAHQLATWFKGEYDANN